MSVRDAEFLLYLPIFTAVAWLVPQRYWPRLCLAVARASAALRPGLASERRRLIQSRLGDTADIPSLRDRLSAHVHESRVHYLRCWRPDEWRPALELRGREHIDTALRTGRGAILWVAPFAFSDLLTKMALFQAGYAATHLSRIEHGPSRSRLGIRCFNPIWTGIEERYLSERLVMAPGGGAAALWTLAAALEQNAVVSIGATPFAQRPISLPFLNDSIEIAPGAPALARRRGAALLPAFTVRDGDAYVTTIEAPLAASSSEAASVAAEYVQVFERYVRRWPDQLLDLLWQGNLPAEMA